MTERTPEGDIGSSPLDEHGLEDLRKRLDELQGSIERLGTENEEPPPSPSPSPPAHDPGQGFGYPPAPPERPPAPPPADSYPAPPPTPYAPAPSPPYAYPGDEPAYEQPEVPPPPAATNGHSEETSAPAAVSASIATLDAGPFSDLVELRRFEEALAGLGSVRDVRVRRFGHRRARIEVGMAGAYALTNELHRIGLPMSIDQGPGGEVVVQLPDPEAAPDEAGAPSPAAEAQSAGAEAAGDSGDGS